MALRKAAKTMRPKRVLFATLGSALLLSPALLTARQEQESVADAARKAQAEKKPPAKPAMVITNDNLDTIKGTISIVGTEPAPPELRPRHPRTRARRLPPVKRRLRSRTKRIGGRNLPTLGRSSRTMRTNSTFCSANTI